MKKRLQWQNNSNILHSPACRAGRAKAGCPQSSPNQSKPCCFPPALFPSSLVPPKCLGPPDHVAKIRALWCCRVRRPQSEAAAWAGLPLNTVQGMCPPAIAADQQPSVSLACVVSSPSLCSVTAHVGPNIPNKDMVILDEAPPTSVQVPAQPGQVLRCWG